MNYSVDFTKYLTHASVAFLTFSAYDVFVEGKDFYNYAVNDAGSFALASIGSLWTVDLLSGVWGGLNANSLQHMIAKPLFSALFYMYLYDYMVRPNNVRFASRTGTETFIMGGLGDVITSYLENPLSSLFGYRNYN